jgi:sulfate adenylyltransferase
MALNTPHGGGLRELLVSPDHAAALKKEAIGLPNLDLNFRQVCDLELLLCGAFSPLAGYLGKKDYDAVVKRMRLADGTLWPMPITLDAAAKWVADNHVATGTRVALRHPEGMLLAVMTVGDVWQPDLAHEADKVFGTKDTGHPGVFTLLHETKDTYLGGTLEGLELPPHHTYQRHRYTPAQLRAQFEKRGWTRVVAFQTRNPMHRAHVELTKRASSRAEAALLIQPVVGRTSPGDLDHFTRLRCYEAVLDHYPEQSTMLGLLPLAMRMGGPREAVWHAIIRKNFGATHFIVGRDHAGPSDPKTGKSYYGPSDAVELVRAHEAEIGIEIVDFENMVYVEDKAEYMAESEVPDGARVLNLSGTEFRRRLRQGLDIPEWFSYREVVDQLRLMYPPRDRQGFTVFFTGLPSSGKSTVANILVAKLMEQGHRPVTLLDGDIVRTHLSSELTFSKEHRDVNIRRIGYVASEITKNGGVAVCAPIAPYDVTRKQVRRMIENYGGFVLVHISTPVAVCEERDRKGLYAKARAGLLREFTGVDDPYEVPADADLHLDTSDTKAEEAANHVLFHLEAQGYV